MSDFYLHPLQPAVAEDELSHVSAQPHVFTYYPSRRRYWLHALLFLATVFTTLIVGAQLQFNFINDLPAFSIDQGFFPLGWIAQQPTRLLLGIPFSATLMLILLAHELGHFFACQRYRVYATLPYFLPAPTLIGTLGAFIRIRSPISSRKALFDIGIAGPIAGFVIAEPALALGLWISKVSPALVNASDFQLGNPAIFHGMWWLIWHGSRMAMPANANDAMPPLQSVYLHPVAVAAWVGMFATALNLLPGGQLDGGHILYALWPRAHKHITRITVVALVLMTPFLWPGWLLWAVVLLTLGGRHPSVPLEPGLNGRRTWLAIFALLIFGLTFMPVPFPGTALSWP